jgi:hypothetical protein
MPRRIWIAEGIASDGEIYGRAMQLPDGNMRHRSTASWFAEVDIGRSVATNRRIITQLLLAEEEVALSGHDTALQLRLPDPLQLTNRTRLELLPDTPKMS